MPSQQLFLQWSLLFVPPRSSQKNCSRKQRIASLAVVSVRDPLLLDSSAQRRLYQIAQKFPLGQMIRSREIRETCLCSYSCSKETFDTWGVFNRTGENGVRFKYIFHDGYTLSFTITLCGLQSSSAHSLKIRWAVSLPQPDSYFSTR